MKASEFQAQSSNHVKNEHYWQKIFEDFEASNLIRSVYCHKNQINYYNFGYWWKKLRTKSLKKLIPIKIKPEPVLQPESNRALSALTFKNGHSLVIYDNDTLLLILSKMI